MEIKLIDKNTARVRLSKKRERGLIESLREEKELYNVERESNRYVDLIFKFRKEVNFEDVVSYMYELKELAIFGYKING